MATMSRITTSRAMMIIVVEMVTVLAPPASACSTCAAWADNACSS